MSLFSSYFPIQKAQEYKQQLDHGSQATRFPGIHLLAALVYNQSYSFHKQCIEMQYFLNNEENSGHVNLRYVMLMASIFFVTPQDKKFF